MEDPEIELVNHYSHLFRHASEITKETKGGYLGGFIRFPKVSTPQFLRISLAPAQPDATANPLNLHPLLLHMNIRENKRQRQQEIKVP